MLRIDKSGKRFHKLESRTLADSKLLERYHLQRMICESSDIFFSDLDEKLLLIGEEIRPSDFCDVRIDLLALDQDGSAVVIEIKRESNRLQLLQALSYAAMVYRWKPERFISERVKFTSKTLAECQEDVSDFRSIEGEGIGRRQRIVLLAEHFDFEVLSTAEWLTEEYDLDIRCYRIQISADGENEYASCARIFPPPELDQASIARKNSNRSSSQKHWTSWDEVFASCANPALAAFFKNQIDNGRDNELQGRALKIGINGKNRWWVSLKKDRAYVWQRGRFEGDLEYWKNCLSDPGSVRPVDQNLRLRFYLRNASDCEKFIGGSLSKLPVVSSGDAVQSGEDQEDLPTRDDE